MIRVHLPHHLQTLARCGREVELQVQGIVTQRTILDALEARFPMLCGTIREHGSATRRPRVRFYADGVDMTHESPDEELPASVSTGRQPFLIVAAISGG